jgi:hypothetical protein
VAANRQTRIDCKQKIDEFERSIAENQRLQGEMCTLTAENMLLQQQPDKDKQHTTTHGAAQPNADQRAALRTGRKTLRDVYRRSIQKRPELLSWHSSEKRMNGSNTKICR